MFGLSSFSVFSSVFGFVSSLFKSKSSTSIDIILILLLIILLGTGFYKYKELKNSNTMYELKLKNSQDSIKEYKNKIIDLKKVNSDNIEKLNTISSNYEKNIILLKKKLKNDSERIEEITKLKDKILYSDPSDDAPTAKVLKDTLDRIRTLQKGNKK